MGLEKVRNAHSVYTVAVGVLPEMSKNVSFIFKNNEALSETSGPLHTHLK